jgi:FixJ family two-component response regulator
MGTSTDVLVAVVDDDGSVRKALGRLLRSAGLSVQTFASAEDFLEAGPAAACVILDQRLPGLSGLELYRRLAAEGRPVAAVFITGHKNEPTRREALSAGAVAFLLKPFDDEVLLRAVSEAVTGEMSPPGEAPQQRGGAGARSGNRPGRFQELSGAVPPEEEYGTPFPQEEGEPWL